MKKTRRLNPAAYSVVILALTVLLGSGIVAGLRKNDILYYIRVTDSTGKKVMYRASDFAADGTLSIGMFDRDIDVLVQFREVDGDEKATVFVSKYYADGEGNVYPLTEKCGVTVFGQNDASDKPLQLGSVKDSTFALTADSEMTLEASPGTALKFTLGEESGFRLAETPFRAEYSNNGSTPVAVSASGSGSVWNISSDYAVDNAVISVDVYYIPTYRVRYHGNGNESGSEPADTREYATGDILGTAEHPLADKGSLARRGFIFDGWSTESGDGNGATGGQAPADSHEYAEDDTPEVLGRNTLEKTDSQFNGWNTKADGSGEHYGEGDRLSGMKADVTLYAEWKDTAHEPDPEPQKFRVTYDGNGATGGNVPEDNTEYVMNQEVTVLQQGDLAKDGYTFKGWNTQADGKGTTYQPSGKFHINGNVTLYAMWTKNVDTPDHPGKPGNPGTGESVWLIVAAAAAMLLSLASVVAVLYRRRKG